MTTPACGWNPTTAGPACDWDRTCPQHGDTMTAEERLTAYLCQQPGTEHMDQHHADMAREILAQHTRELGREPDASYWRKRFETEANVRWDDGCPPGGMVCATCGEPVESEPCPEHNPKAMLSGRQSSIPPGRTDGLGVIALADMLRDDAKTLARLDRKEIESTDDPLTLMRCLYEAVEALAEIAPHALTAARLDPQTAAPSGAGVADIPGRVTVGLGSSTTALWDAYNSI